MTWVDRHVPDGWVLGKYKDDLKIFCSWSGGYLDGESWRLNSKVRTVEVDEEEHYLVNKDVSEYFLHFWGYARINPYNGSILSALEDKGFVVLSPEEAKAELESFLVDK